MRLVQSRVLQKLKDNTDALLTIFLGGGANSKVTETVNV